MNPDKVKRRDSLGFEIEDDDEEDSYWSTAFGKSADKKLKNTSLKALDSSELDSEYLVFPEPSPLSLASSDVATTEPDDSVSKKPSPFNFTSQTLAPCEPSTVPPVQTSQSRPRGHTRSITQTKIRPTSVVSFKKGGIHLPSVESIDDHAEQRVPLITFAKGVSTEPIRKTTAITSVNFFPFTPQAPARNKIGAKPKRVAASRLQYRPTFQIAPGPIRTIPSMKLDEITIQELADTLKLDEEMMAKMRYFIPFIIDEKHFARHEKFDDNWLRVELSAVISQSVEVHVSYLTSMLFDEKMLDEELREKLQVEYDELVIASKYIEGVMKERANGPYELFILILKLMKEHAEREEAEKLVEGVESIEMREKE